MAALLPFRKSRSAAVWPLLVSLALGPVIFSGCVRRRLTVRSNPPGALVYVDDQEIGTTPVSTGFVYYGTREIRAVLDGYETPTVLEKIRPPWYQLPPLDFISENLWPWELRDERIVDLQLVPKAVVPRQELLGRADNLRQSSREGYVAPLPTAPPAAASDQLEQLPTPRPAEPPSADEYHPNLAFPPPPPP